MKYSKMTEGVFIRRPNRFIAEVAIGGRVEKAHVKNTGRCRELLKEGTPVLLEPADNPSRKTKYSLINVRKEQQWVNMDSAAPNVVVEEMVREGRLFSDVTCLQREKRFGNSRFDLYVETGDPADRRIKMVQITANGTNCCCRAVRYVRTAEEQLLAGLTDEERAAFYTLLLKLCRSFGR